MLKYIVTSECPLLCSYCLTRNIKVPESNDYDLMERVLKSHADRRHIMITGGEPTSSPSFMVKAFLCYEWFDSVFLTTSNPDMLENNVCDDWLTAITFSIHAGLHPKLVVSKSQIPVYAAVMADRYTWGLAGALLDRGFAGLTINEDQRSDGPPFDQPVESLDGFLVRINRRGYCMDETVILPDFSVAQGFRGFL